jgi:hypothetical protein
MLINCHICFGKVSLMIVLKNKCSFFKDFNHIDVCLKNFNTKKNVNISDATLAADSTCIPKQQV